MDSYIPEPKFSLDLNDYLQGKIKFFNMEKGFGFVLAEDNEFFIHRSWLYTPICCYLDGMFYIGFDKAVNWQPKTDSIVLFKPGYNAERNTYEATNVIDRLKVDFVKDQLEKDWKQAFNLWSVLHYYKVILVQDILVPKADNSKKEWVFEKNGSQETLLFEGNNLERLMEILNRPHIKEVLNRPNVHLEYYIGEPGNFVRCESPLSG